MVVWADEMPDGFLKELLGQYPFGQGHGEAGAEEDDGEYAIYEQADDDDDDDDWAFTICQQALPVMDRHFHCAL